MQSDLSADQASYFLFRVDGNKSWLLITVVPDGVPVRKIEIDTYSSGEGENDLR